MIYCVFDCFGGNEYRDMVRNKINDIISRPVIQYQYTSVAFYSIRKYFEQPMGEVAFIKLLASIACCTISWTSSQKNQRQYSYYLFIAIIVINELFFWHWRLILKEENSDPQNFTRYIANKTTLQSCSNRCPQ